MSDDPIEQAAEIARAIDGAIVSVDVSTGDHDAGSRIFARVYSAQREADGSLTLLAEYDHDNIGLWEVAEDE